MALSWLSKFLASILVLLLFIGVVGLTLSQTLFSSKYVEGQLAHTNAYTRLSGAISEQIAKDASSSTPLTTGQLALVVHTVITPAVVQQKITGTLSQLDAYYKGKGPVPTLDVTDLIAQAEALGLPPPKDSNLTHPITLSAATNAKKVNDKLKGVVIAGLLAVVFLAGGLVAIAIKLNKYAPLANVAITLGTFLALVGGVLAFTTSVIDGRIRFDYATNVFAGVAHDVATSIANDIGRRLLIWGVSILFVGLAARILIHRYVKPQTPDVPSLPVQPVPAPGTFV